MSWNDAVKLYGEGDNSTTDRMWYEVAGEICVYCAEIVSSPDNAEERLLSEGVQYVSEKISEHAKDNHDYTLDAIRIVNRLISLRSSFVSRVSVEYVRQQLEQILKKESD